MTKHKHTPFPFVGQESMIDEKIQPPLSYSHSGEITSTTGVFPLGDVRRAGRVIDVSMSVNSCGRDDSSPLIISGEIYINGTTCLTTRPSIAFVSGEAPQQKTTRVTGDSGITQAVIDTTANTVVPGDVITGIVTLDRTASPETEINNLIISVDFEPVNASPNAF
uniref:Uncharacterized protein n=1 Tax=viral metagenome TaxID=1070528 RepID=A0A6M3J8R9_9ZZZZ